MTLSARKIVLGCRNSRLAIAQANEVANALTERFDDIEIERVCIKTSGDNRPDVAISEIGVGVFVKEIEAALLEGEIDIAVHSLKDLPSQIADGLVISGVPYREDPRDVVVSKLGVGLNDLPTAAIVGTGSARRRALINAERGDVILKPIRGNVTTRLAMLDDEDSVIDALVLAAAGLKRLGMSDRISEYLGCMSFVAAPGQGALALQTRAEDDFTSGLCSAIEHAETRFSVDSERAFLAHIGGGCSAPIGAHAQIDDGTITLAAFVSEPSGTQIVRHRESSDIQDGIELGKRVADNLIKQGALELLPQLSAVSNA